MGMKVGILSMQRIQNYGSFLQAFGLKCILEDLGCEVQYACEHRHADITLGGYWGIEKQHFELLERDGWDESKGISCVILNTKKGASVIRKLNILLYESTFHKISERNDQLRTPSSPGKRDEILRLYSLRGWSELDKQFNEKIGLKKHVSWIKSILPLRMKRMVKAFR